MSLSTGVNIATGPAHGTITGYQDGEFKYTPNAGYSGTDSFTYTITDHDGDTSTATVTLNVQNTTALTQASAYGGVVEEEQLGHVTPSPQYPSSFSGNEDTTAAPDNDADTAISGPGSLITAQTVALSTSVAGGTGPYAYHFARLSDAGAVTDGPMTSPARMCCCISTATWLPNVARRATEGAMTSSRSISTIRRPVPATHARQRRSPHRAGNREARVRSS